MKKYLFGLLLLLTFTLFMIFYLRGHLILVNKPLYGDVRSAKVLVSIIEPYVKNYWRDRKYNIGEINMYVDKNLKGEVSIEFADETSISSPNVVEAVVDTMLDKIVYIKKIGSDSKLNPGKISFEYWTIDSIKAVEITLKAFLNEEKFYYDSMVISGRNMGIGKDSYDAWYVNFKNSLERKSYQCFIDPYNGEIIRKDEVKWP